MLALPHEYLGATCEIKSLENDLLSVGRIIKIDNEALEMSGQNGERLPLLQYRMPVKMFVHGHKLDTRILVGTAYLSTENFVRIEEVKPLQNFERRGAFRVNTNITGLLTKMFSDEEQAAFDKRLATASGEEAEALRDTYSFEVRVMDISLTGVRLQSARPLVPGSRFFIDFKLLDSVLNLCLRVQRLIDMPNGEVQYGCTFFDFSERQMDILCKELFQLQRFEKNRRMNSVTAL